MLYARGNESFYNSDLNNTADKKAKLFNETTSQEQFNKELRLLINEIIILKELKYEPGIV